MLRILIHRSDRFRKGLFLVALGLVLAAASTASAVSIVVSGPADGPYAAGTSLDFTVSFDTTTGANGFDMFFVWDTAELTFNDAINLFPDFLAPDTLPFTVERADLGTATRGVGRVSSIGVALFTTTDLFSLNFTATGTGNTPGSALPSASLIVAFVVAGQQPGGLSPGSLTIDNPDLGNVFQFSVTVPEPGTLALVGLGLGGLGLLALRRRRS